MKPLNIKMSAFGPYADFIEIDMTRLSGAGVYLVTGDTGAGKTTIFDAITFALYGEASGVSRDASMLRSKYAKSDTKTFVEMTFSCKGKIYNVRRNPEYDRPSLRGEKMTKEKADAVLLMPDGTVVTKTKDVTAKIREIIGLDKNQFSQIVMIAQGDFLKLLQSSTEERMKILREIFNTRHFVAIQDKLREHSADLKSEYELITQSIHREAKSVICEKGFPPADALLEITQNGSIPSVEEVIALIENIIENDKALYEECEKALKTAENGYTAASNEYVLAVEEIKRLKQITTLEQSKKKISAELKVLEENYKKLLDSKPLAEALKNEAASDEAQLEAYLEADTLKKRTEQLNADIAQKTSESERLNLTLQTLKSESENLKELINSANTAFEKSGQLLAEIKDNEAKLEYVSKLLDSFDEYSSIKISLEELKSKYKSAADLKNEYAKKYLAMDKAYFDGQAGIIASRLSDDEPCPVCGSRTHPSPAALPENVVTKDELDRAQKLLADYSENAARLSEMSKAKHDALNAVYENILKSSKQLFGDAELTEYCQKAKALKSEQTVHLNKLKSAYERCLGITEKKKSAEAKLLECESKISEITVQQGEVSLAISALRATADSDEKRAASLSEKLKYKTLSEAQEQIRQKRLSAQKAENSIESARLNTDKCSGLLSQTKAQLKALKEQTVSESVPNLEALTQKLDEHTARKKVLSENSKELNRRIKSNELVAKTITDEHKRLEKLSDKINTICAMSDTANGNLAGKQKIKLETFVQASFFDSIIAKANIRLLAMSQRQYELVRRKDEQNFKNQIGLELDVIDHYNGTTRSVHSLSGGESFKASLALALGLSDAVQGYSGGITVDTLFIDEGFGSLDSDSLKSALETLCELSDGNRLVGIISHVEELKEKIDRQIVVTKQKSGGSKIEIIV